MSRRTPLLGAIIALVLVAAWFLAFWQPAGHRLSGLRTQTAAAVTQRMTAEASLVRLEDLERQLPAEEASLKASLPALPVAASVDTIIDQIDALAASCQVTWTQESQTLSASATATTTPTTTATTATTAASTSSTTSTTVASGSTGGLSTVALTLSVAGSYPNMERFITGLLLRPRLIVIQNLAFSPSGERVAVEITATAFYDPTPTPVAPGTRS